jgi:AcrR family transcriptional regulator
LPKRVDHEARRAAIVDALFRVAARDGLHAASIRAVAAEAAVPASQVQYYFATKAHLLDAALEALGRRIVGRGMALIQAAGENPPPEALLRAATAGSHPVDDETRDNLKLFFIFLGAALTEPEMSDTQLVVAQRFIAQTFAEILREGQRRGDVPKSLDADHEARLIMFANTGLILAALAGIHSVADAQATLEYHLARVFPQKKRR